MKPRCLVKIDDIPMYNVSVTVQKQSHRYPDTATITVENTDCKYNEIFGDPTPSKVEIFFRYEDVQGLTDWYKTFVGYVDNNVFTTHSIAGSKLTIPCRSQSVLLADDTWTHKWEKAHLKPIIYDLVHGWFPIDFQCPNYYIGEHMIEEKSRWSDICEFAELFSCICYINNAGVLYFGPYNKNEQWIYQFLNNYPRKIDQLNANIEEWTIDQKKSGFPYNKFIIVKKDEDKKEIYKGVTESTIARITGRQKTYTLDHKYLQSDKMAKELSDWMCWKYEREYITATIKSYGIPFINPEHVIELVDIPNYSGFYWVKSITLKMEDDFTSDITAVTRDPKERFNG